MGITEDVKRARTGEEGTIVAIPATTALPAEAAARASTSRDVASRR